MKAEVQEQKKLPLVYEGKPQQVSFCSVTSQQVGES